MHKSSMKRMEWFVNRYLQTTKKLEVLDVGSYDVNGCYKELFKPNEFNYVGLDMEKGPNVDLVPFSPYEWVELKKDSFDVVISGQAMEHIEFFWVTVAEISLRAHCEVVYWFLLLSRLVVFLMSLLDFPVYQSVPSSCG